MRDYWSLPGPARFLDRVLEMVSEGHSVAVATPRRCLPGVAEAIERRLHEASFNVDGPFPDDGRAPIAQIFEQIEVALPPRWSMADLCRHLPPGRVLFVSGVGPDCWAKWHDLLREYEAASRSVSTFDRARLVVLLNGVPQVDLPRKAAALSVAFWDDVIGELDVLLHIDRKFADRKTTRDARSRLLARIVVRLGSWDLSLVDFLLDCPPESLFTPRDVLLRAMTELDIGRDLGPDWTSGGRMRFDGAEIVHSIALLRDGDGAGEIGMRLWAAQAAEILPALELRRRELARRMRPMVTMPLQLGESTYADLDDLELGQLGYVAHKQRLSPAISRAADKWKSLRNKLAHLETLEAREALDSELLTE